LATIRPVGPSPRFPFKRYRVVYKVAGEQRQFGLYDTFGEAEQAKRDCETQLAKGRNPGAKHTRSASSSSRSGYLATILDPHSGYGPSRRISTRTSFLRSASCPSRSWASCRC